MTKRYRPAFSFVTFFPPRVSVIVNPGPTVPLTIWAAGAAEAIVEAASAAAPTRTNAAKAKPARDAPIVVRDITPPLVADLRCRKQDRDVCRRLPHGGPVRYSVKSSRSRG